MHRANDRYRRTGTLWEDQYKARLVDSESHLPRCFALSLAADESERCAAGRSADGRPGKSGIPLGQCTLIARFILLRLDSVPP